MLSRRSFDRPSTVQRRWAGARAKERACACACACVYAVGVPSQLVAAITNAVDQTGKLINECDAHSEMAKFCRRGEHHSHLEKLLHLRAVVGLGDHANKLHVPHRRGHLQVRPPAPQLWPGSTKPGVRLARRLHHLRARSCPAARRRSASARASARARAHTHTHSALNAYGRAIYSVPTDMIRVAAVPALDGLVDEPVLGYSAAQQLVTHVLGNLDRLARCPATNARSQLRLMVVRRNHAHNHLQKCHRNTVYRTRTHSHFGRT